MPHTQGSVCLTRHFCAAESRASESELMLTCPTPSCHTVVYPGQSKCTDWYLWFKVYMVFSSTKIANIGQQGKRTLLLICILLNYANHHWDSSAIMDYPCKFSTLDQHRKFNQLPWPNMWAHLTNETSYWRLKLLMHLNWAIYDVCDLNIDPYMCFYPTLSQDRPIPLAQPEACSRCCERLVCTHSPHRSWNGYRVI